MLDKMIHMNVLHVKSKLMDNDGYVLSNHFQCSPSQQHSQYERCSFSLHLFLNLSLQIQLAALVEFALLNFSLQISLKKPLVGFGVNQQGDQSPSVKMQPAHLLQSFRSALPS